VRARFFLLAAGLVAAILTAGGVGTALASQHTATVPTIHVCRSAKTGALFLWGGCPKGYTPYTWNVAGPAGPRGATGLTGARGATGPSFASSFSLTIAVASNGPFLQYTCSDGTGTNGAITGITCVDPVGILAHNGTRK
jgi:hypothetical protein